MIAITKHAEARMCERGISEPVHSGSTGDRLVFVTCVTIVPFVVFDNSQQITWLTQSVLQFMSAMMG